MKRSVTNFAPKVVSAEAERETTWATLSYSTWALCLQITEAVVCV